jgi:hypothetical protein
VVQTSFSGAPGTVVWLGGILDMVSFGRSFRQTLSLIAIEFGTYDRDCTLQVCGDGHECSHHVGQFRIERGGSACTFCLVNVSIRLSESQ